MRQNLAQSPPEESERDVSHCDGQFQGYDGSKDLATDPD